MTRVHLTPCYLIHQRPYRESSALIDVFSEQYGRISLIAKGVKRKGKKRLPLHYFTPLEISWTGLGSLKTLSQVENSHYNTAIISGTLLYCGFYLNELLYHLLKPLDPYPELFAEFHLALKNLTTQPIEAVLRRFELQFLNQLGYRINCQNDIYQQHIQEQKYYHFDGLNHFYPAPTTENVNRLISGKQIQAIAHCDFSNNTTLKVAKNILRQAINHILDGKILHSRTLINDLIVNKRQPPDTTADTITNIAHHS